MEAAAAAKQAENAASNSRRKRRGEFTGKRAKRVASCGQKARSLQRLLEHKKDLAEDVQAKMRATVEALQKQHRQRLKQLKRQKFIRAKKALYSKLKFFELKKVQRRLQQTRKQLIALLSKQQEEAAVASTTDRKKQKEAETPDEAEREEALAERIAELQQKLRAHLDNLNYIRLYPLNEPYVALFPAQDSEESQRKRDAMRMRIRELLLNSRMAEEENGKEEAGGDDMFVGAGEEKQEDAAPADPFEEARALSDEEAEMQQGRGRPRLGQKPQGHLRGDRGTAHFPPHKRMQAGNARRQKKQRQQAKEQTQSWRGSAF